MNKRQKKKRGVVYRRAFLATVKKCEDQGGGIIYVPPDWRTDFLIMSRRNIEK